MDISVIIPIGPGHELLAKKAVHSVLMQDRVNFELIVVKDTPNALELSETINIIEGRQEGPSAARNDGAKVAKGEAFVFLDADDTLCPGALFALWTVYEKVGTIVYGNVIRSDKMEVHRSPDQYCDDDIKQTSLYMPKRMPTHLIPRTAFFAVDGWDEEIALWEDVDLEIKLDIAGYCATRIEYPIYFYNWESGTRRESELADQAKQQIKIKYEDYFKGKKIMGCSSCGGSKKGVPRYTNTVQDNNMLSLFNTKILELEYTGGDPSVRTYVGPVTGKEYRFGATRAERNRKVRVGFGEGEVHPDDAKEMERLSDRNHGKQFKINVIGSKEPTQAQPKPPREGVKKNLKMKMETEEADQLKNAIWAGMSVDQFTVAELRDAINAVPPTTLTRWLEEESTSENPRVTVTRMLEDKLETNEDVGND